MVTQLRLPFIASLLVLLCANAPIFAQNNTTALARDLPKWLGNVWSPSQIQDFAIYWNQVTPENAGKWGSVEGTRGVMNWGFMDAAYSMAKQNGWPIRFHVLLWGNQQPTWIRNLPPAEQLQEIREWFQAVADRYPALDYVEVVNEPLHDRPDVNCCNNSTTTDHGNYIQALGGAGATGWDWIITAFELAREIFPSTTKLMINEYSVTNQSPTNSTSNMRRYIQIINLLKERNLIDAVGVQGHAFSTRNVPVSTTLFNLNLLAETGLPIQITEMDIDGNPTQSDRVSLSGSDNTQRNEFMRVFPVFWEHPDVEGITLWGWREGMWRTNTEATLVYTNSAPAALRGQPRPALIWLQEYMDLRRELLTTIENPDPLPGLTRLDGNYPNPFNPTTHIRYQLAEPGHVTLSVYDLMGRHIETIVDSPLVAGTHVVSFNASGLASGVYLYRLSTATSSQVMRMTLLK